MKFLIMVEVAFSQPNVRQKDIAKKLGLTNQAISEYFHELCEEGWVAAIGRSKYKLTKEGVDWLLRAYRGLMEYTTEVKKAITGISVCAAIADRKVEEGQMVGLVMKEGLLYATSPRDASATGTAVNPAGRGEDVGITSIEGVIDFERGKIFLIQVPTVEKGGSRKVDPARLKSLVKGQKTVGAVGIEAYVSLVKAGKKPDYFYGVIEAAVEAANSGLDFCIVASEDYYPLLVARFREASLEYEIQDLSS
jgi:putative transcriptional regulator